MKSAWNYVYLAAATMLASPVVTPAPLSTCSSPVAATVEPLGEPRLCEYHFDGGSENFTCQAYQGTTGRYVAAFRGGRTPQAIFSAVGQARSMGDALWIQGEDPGVFDCAAGPPRGVPAGADYIGTGVCETLDGDLAPCRMYRHAAARQYHIQLYLVSYEPAGGGPMHIEAQAVGVNHDALAAELAYQLGVSLSQTECCKAQGESYIAYAYQLFPRDAVYRDQYLSGGLRPGELAADAGR
ncbi:MAG: hypothetical protein JSW10_08865 [Pseudomonadota bacterium]|nr:MAG: hypothetical protein JSW10_08865 [Pseudomonadota bacterium]